MRKLLASRALRNTAAWLAASLLALPLSAQLSSDPFYYGVAVLAVGLGVIRLAGLVVFRAALPAAGMQPARIVEEVTLLGVYVAWGILRLRAAGVDPASLVTTSAVITAVAAFAMQDTLGNVLSGLFLELDRSIAMGDWVRLEDLSGRVAEIRWRHTTIRLRNGELAVVPNSTLMKARFIVVGNPDLHELRLRRTVHFEVDFHAPAAKVIAAAQDALAAAEIDNIVREPKPDCVLLDLELGQARYALRYSISDPQRDESTASAVRVHLLAAFEREGIDLSLPKQVALEEKATEGRRASLRAREVERRAAALRGVEIFSMLTEAERSSLARRLVHAPFAAGDVVTRQGAVANWLYILTGGEVEVWLEDAGRPRRRVAKLGPGSVFGEMGMMTGAPRRATVSAATEIECYRLDKEAFSAVLHARPEIAESLSQILALRAAELSHAQSRAQGEEPVRGEGLLERIRAFFGLPEAPGTSPLT